MKYFDSLGQCAQHFEQMFNVPFGTMYRHMLECPTRYAPSKNGRLRKQLVPQEGALSHVEGVFLYALVCLLGARDIVELGTFAGHSTNYLADAARETNGTVDTVDLVRYWGGLIRGSKITLKNRSVVQQYKRDAWDFLTDHRVPDSVDIIFEDSSHTFPDTLHLIDASKNRLKSGGVLMLHDVAVSEVGVNEAVNGSGLDFISFKIWPGEYGIALWRKP